MRLGILIDAPGFENLKQWTIVCVVVTNKSAGTSDPAYYAKAYAFIRLINPAIEIKDIYVQKGGLSLQKTNIVVRGDEFYITGKAQLPNTPGLRTPNWLWIFVEDGNALGIGAQTYTLFGMVGTLEKVHILDKDGKFESSSWEVAPNAPLKSYRVYAIITEDGSKPTEDNIMNMTYVNLTVVPSDLHVKILPEQAPPGSFVVIYGYTQMKYVYVYTDEDVFDNIPSYPSKPLRFETYLNVSNPKHAVGYRDFKIPATVKESAKLGNYTIYLYTSNQNKLEKIDNLNMYKIRFEVVPLRLECSNLTIVMGENGFIKCLLNGELRCKIEWEFDVYGRDYHNTTYSFGNKFVFALPGHYTEEYGSIKDLTYTMGEWSIPPGIYPLKVVLKSAETDRVLLKKTLYVRVVEPKYNLTTLNTTESGDVIVLRGKPLVINITSNRMSPYYDWIFLGIESGVGLQKYTWVALRNGRATVTIPTDDLVGRSYTIYLRDLMGSGNKYEVLSYYWKPAYMCRDNKGGDDILLKMNLLIVDTLEEFQSLTKKPKPLNVTPVGNATDIKVILGINETTVKEIKEIITNVTNVTSKSTTSNAIVIIKSTNETVIKKLLNGLQFMSSKNTTVDIYTNVNETIIEKLMNTIGKYNVSVEERGNKTVVMYKYNAIAIVESNETELVKSLPDRLENAVKRTINESSVYVTVIKVEEPEKPHVKETPEEVPKETPEKRETPPPPPAEKPKKEEKKDESLLSKVTGFFGSITEGIKSIPSFITAIPNAVASFFKGVVGVIGSIPKVIKSIPAHIMGFLESIPNILHR